MNFKAGDKVVCVDDSPGSNYPDIPIPFSKGEIHCVESLHLDGDACYLVGVHTALLPPLSPIRVSWFNSRFRLVSEVKLIMEAVRHNHIGKEVPEPVTH